MSHPEKESQNEKLKTLREIAILNLNLLVDENIEIKGPYSGIEDFVQTQNALIDELETLIEPEEPE